MSNLEYPLILRHIGSIDPETIAAYEAVDGYQAFRKALTQMTPEAVLEEVERSGLRGRGGGGFPTGRKWRFCRQAEGDVKFVICNGSEGDPGAFLDRSIMEGNPHAIVEGMILGGYAIGALWGHIYVGHDIPWPFSVCVRLSSRPEKKGIWEPKSSTPILPSISKFIAAAAPMSAARKPPSSPLSKAISANPGPGPLIRPRPVFGACPRSLTMWKPGPIFPALSHKALPGLPASAPRRAKVRKSFPSPAPSMIPDWWKCPWGLLCARLFMTWAAASPRITPLRQLSPAAPPAVSCRNSFLIYP